MPVAGVAQQRGGDLLPLQHVLHADQEVGKHLRRHGQVLDDRHRPARPLHAGTTAAASCWPAARKVGLLLVEGLPGGEGQPLAAGKARRPRRCIRWRTSSGSSPSYSTSSSGLGLAGISRSKRISLSRARLRWRRSIRSQAAGAEGSISRRPGRPSPGSRTAAGPRRDAAAAACVASVASVIKRQRALRADQQRRPGRALVAASTSARL